jgi:Zn-finger nucleic acid-binding protein
MHTTTVASMSETTVPAVPRCLPAPLDRTAPDVGSSTGKLLCPRCGIPILQECVRDGVGIDLCQQCRGMWLDCGKLERLIAGAIHGHTQHAQPALYQLSARDYAELFWDEA